MEGDVTEPRKKTKVHVCCLSCGYTGKSFVLTDCNGVTSYTSKCPKCSNTAYTCNLMGLVRFMQSATREIVSLKSSVSYLEAAIDTDER